MFFHTFSIGFIEVPTTNSSLNIYTVGCPHHCEGCHAADLQDINHPERQILTSKMIFDKIETGMGFIESICWLGGDPFYQFKDCYKISKEIKEKYPNLPIVVYTGYTLDFIRNEHRDIDWSVFNIIIDGKWNGHMLGQNECNQKIYEYINENFKEISYAKFCGKE